MRNLAAQPVVIPKRLQLLRQTVASMNKVFNLKREIKVGRKRIGQNFNPYRFVSFLDMRYSDGRKIDRARVEDRKRVRSLVDLA